MTHWKLSPKIKIYEALGSIADQRIELDGNTAKVYSSSGNKFYTVTYDPSIQAIMSNDNGSYWLGYLGYPSIAYLLKIGVIPYDPTLPPLLANIKWKEVNTKLKNDWEQTEKYCQDLVIERGGDLSHFLLEIDQIYDWLVAHPLNLLGKKIKPPTGY